MSYLNGLRVHFAGKFQANISTVNNDPAHYYNAKFTPDDQKYSPGAADGWFNPQGNAVWRLLGCRVTSAWTPSGRVAGGDRVLACVVADSDRQAPAKLVDLDTEQQLVSEIWGLQVRILDPDSGETLLCGDFEPAAFIDIWKRADSGGDGDMNAAAMYQSVLTGLEWGDVAASPFLAALQGAAGDGLLSIKFDVDGLEMDRTSADFMCGRIVGTIGPAAAHEPHHMVIGRQFVADCPETGGFPVPSGRLFGFAGVVDEAAGCVYLDLGNALPTAVPGGPLVAVGDLTLTVDGGAPGVNPLGTIPASTYAGDPDWYASTAGVVALPLSADQLDAIAAAPLVLSGEAGVVVGERATGGFVRADRFVYRVSPGETIHVPVYATQWGRRLEGTVVRFEADASQLQQVSYTEGIEPPPVATPPEALGLAPGTTAPTDADGRAVLTLTPSDPGTPRFFDHGSEYGIDGQVYGIRPSFDDPALRVGPQNQWHFVSIRLWSGFTPSHPPAWADVGPILQQYANLYPVMYRFLDLGDPASVLANVDFMRLAFGLGVEDPNTMPVTRDLSPAKRAAVLAWLDRPDVVPTGEEPAAATAARRSDRPPEAATEPVDAAAAAEPSTPTGGKTAAVSRRLVLREQ